MADSKVTGLSAITSASTDDLLYIVDDPGGTPASKKITFDNAQKSLTVVGKVAVIQPATGSTLTIVDGATLTASATAIVSGTNTGDQTSVTGNAGTVTIVDAGGDTTTFPLLGTAATGSLAPATDAGLSYNATTNVLTVTGSVVSALTGNVTGNVTGDVTGNVSGTSGSTTGNAATVTVADAGGDTTTFPLLATDATGSLSPRTDAGLTYNATTNALTATTFIGALTGNASTATNQSGTNTGDQLIFKTIAVSGQSDVVADTTADTLTLVAGTNITITTNAGADSVTITASGGGASPLTTKGDVYTYSSVDARLPVGTNGQVLSADSGETTGLKWIAAPPASAGGSDTEVQFNDSGVLDGNPRFTFDQAASGGVYLESSTGSTNGDGGAIQIVSGNGGASSGDAGDISITGGNAQADDADGGGIFLRAGVGNATAPGASVDLFGGDGGASGAGGPVRIYGGNSGGGNNNGGDINLAAGSGSGSGVNGLINLNSNTNVATELRILDYASIVMPTAISGDGAWSGIITEPGVLGETVAFGEFVYLKAADSQWYKTDANADATAGGKVGVCIFAGNDNSVTSILFKGKVRADSLFPTLTVGDRVFLSTSAGAVTQTAPSGTDDVIRVVGFANTADELYVDISPDSVTHV